MSLSPETLERVKSLMAQGWEAFIGKGLWVEIATRHAFPIKYDSEIDYSQLCEGGPFDNSKWRRLLRIKATPALASISAKNVRDTARGMVRVAGSAGSAARLAALQSYYGAQRGAWRARESRGDTLPPSPFGRADDDIADAASALLASPLIVARLRAIQRKKNIDKGT